MKQIKIIRESSLQDFEVEINKLLSEGWKMKGNFIIDVENFHHQIMIKKQ